MNKRLSKVKTNFCLARQHFTNANAVFAAAAAVIATAVANVSCSFDWRHQGLYSTHSPQNTFQNININYFFRRI